MCFNQHCTTLYTSSKAFQKNRRKSSGVWKQSGKNHQEVTTKLVTSCSVSPNDVDLALAFTSWEFCKRVWHGGHEVPPVILRVVALHVGKGLPTDGIELPTDSQQLEVGSERRNTLQHWNEVQKHRGRFFLPRLWHTHSLHRHLRHLQHLNSSVQGQNAVTTLQLLRTATRDSLNVIDDAAETEEYFILYFSLC